MTAISSLLSRFSLAVCAALVGILVVAAPSSAAIYGTQGVPASPRVAEASVTRGLDFAARSGARILRVQAEWSMLEPVARGQRDPEAVAALDRVIEGASRRGMRTLLVLTSTPCWASSAPAEARGACQGQDANRLEVTRFQPADPASAVPVARFLAGRYAGRLAAFQVWNEPDQSNEKYWAGPDKVVNYVRLVRALYAPLKQAAPTVPVLAGSFVGTNGKWLQAMYDAGVKGSYDGLAVQFYSTTLYALRATREVQRRNGDSKPLWLTEWGYTGCYRKGGPRLQLDQVCVTGSSAAQATTDVLTALRSRPWVAAAVQYDIADGGGYTFGLFTAGGAPKASYFAVRRVLTGKVRRPKRPTVRVRASRGRAVITGTASLTELLTVRVRLRGVLRYRATLVTDRRNRYRIVLPAVLGTRGLGVQVSAGWTGSVSRRT